MRLIKIIVISFLALLILLSVGTYLFVKKRFTPDPNYLELTESSNYVPIKWTKGKYSEYASLLLPVQLEGIPHTFYLQFDTGSPSTLLYKGMMESIREKYPAEIAFIDSNSTIINQTFQLGEMKIHADNFKLYDYGKTPINWGDSSIIRIGTLGADIIEKKITVIDFKNSCCYFGDALPEMGEEIQFHKLIVKGRRTLFPAVVAGRKGNMMHDTGTSGFEFITNKKTWKKLAKEGAEPKEAFKVKSWKRELRAFQVEADAEMEFGSISIPLKQVTYVEGASFMQSAIVRMTGLGGMIGNEVFMDKILILDCKNERYSILD